MNQFKTFLILLFMTMIVIFLGEMIGNMLGGRAHAMNGLIIGCAFAIIINFVSYFFSDKIVLAMYGAKELPHSDTKVVPIVADLVAKAGIPMPKVYIIEDPSPNAFATGRDPHHAAVAVTSGILQILDKNELEGVIAHELSHIKNRDILISTIVAVLAGLITILARILFGGRNSKKYILNLLLIYILVPIAMMLIRMWLSRTREYIADASGAEISGKPWALANALDKLQRGVKDRPMYNTNPNTENMFIVSPFTAKSITGLFSTHPPTEERIKRLKEMNNQILKY